METKIIHPGEIKKAIEAIKKGELISFPTETVYGLGADATNEEAVKKVYLAKGRPSDNPLIIHVANGKQVTPFVSEISVKSQKLMDKFWPGPLTLIFKLKHKTSLPSVVTGGLETAAFRMPNNNITLQLIQESGTVLVGPSANTSGLPSPTTASHVYQDLSGKIFGILDGGPSSVGVESTVLDMSSETGLPVILRPGAITKNQLEEVIGKVTLDQHILSEEEVPKAPGMKYKHYSPNTPVMMIDYKTNNWQEAIDDFKGQNKKVGILNHAQTRKKLSHFDAYYELGEKSDVAEGMRNLFAGLRYLDQSKLDLDIILVETYPDIETGLAYMNRLKKAANQKIYKN